MFLDDDKIEIASECFDKDLDDIQWEPETIDDNSDEMSELFGY